MVRRLSILVIEPDAVARRLSQRLLERLGHAVETLADPGEAIAAAGRGVHDLVLVTRTRDGLDPAAVARAVRAAGRGTVVAVADDVTATDEGAWRSAGVADWLIKPVRPEPLARVIEGRGRASAPGVGDPPPAPPGLAADEMLATRFRDAAPFYVEMLTAFVETSRESAVRMRAAVAADTPGELRAAAHFVKGGALSVGATSAAEQARVLEDWARAAEGGTRDRALDVGDRLSSLDATVEEIARFATALGEWARGRPC